ncbi:MULTISPECIES: protein kinase domain-containing protein [Legionella]|uniref:Protein kinase n=1 Tax=Legionella resiliens TaxID=2905958 RepID=A0ABS8XAR3_9GAMM|nr:MULTISPECIES: protein kinase [unclassified Legionella]MCE0724769.1 protein kinase [Legionella sp. 9fVS26]MCE3533923.1 protein kinase [Legionella sp. 8cVS16]QLZ70157.1 hypothetical protein FOLKNPGA_02962 [Legionella sp. PC1000]
MKKNSKNDSSKKDIDKKQDNGFSIVRAWQATKRKIFKTSSTQENNPSTDGKKQTDSTKEPHIQQEVRTKIDLPASTKQPDKSSLIRNGMIYRYDQKVSEARPISIIDTEDCIDVRELKSEANDTSAYQKENTEVIAPKDNTVRRKKPEHLYKARISQERVYQQPSKTEPLPPRPTTQELIARDVPGTWKQKANQTIDIDLPNSQGKISVKLIASKKLGGGSFGVAKKILVEHPDGRQEKMVVKVIKHGHTSDFKLIEREGEFLEDVGMLMGTKVDASQHKFFMLYVGKKVSRYLINEDPGNMQFNLSNEERYAAINGLLESLAKIHERKIIHSDVGTHNLGLRRHPLSAALFDFNLSVREGERRGNAGIPLTAAPEILKGETNSYASDVYSAGITIALLLEITTYKLLMVPDTDPAPVAFLAPKKDILFGEGDCEEGAITKMQRKFGFSTEQAEYIYLMLEKMTNIDHETRPCAAEASAVFKELLTSPQISMEYHLHS